MVKPFRNLLFAFFFIAVSGLAFAQDTLPPPVSDTPNIRRFVLFADGTHSPVLDSINYGVQTFTNVSVQDGIVGSNSFVNIGRLNYIGFSIYSGNRINLQSGNTTIRLNTVARNDAFVKFPVINVQGDSNQLGTLGDGLMQARGSIYIAPQSHNFVTGPVYFENGYTYSGPTPSYGNPISRTNLPLPVLPALPAQATFPPPGTKDVTSTQSISPGNYNNLNLLGGATITLTEPGVYVFRSWRTSGRNTINYLMPTTPGDGYRIYVHEEIDLDATDFLINGSIPDGPSFPFASRIYTEVHGTGTRTLGGNAVRIASATFNDEIGASWVGTLYATRGSIAIGGTNTNEDITAAVYGAFWSKTKVFVGYNVTVYFYPLSFSPVVIDPYYPPPPNGKTGDKIGAELTAFYNYPDIVKSIPKDNVCRLDTGSSKVWIEVIAMTRNDAALLSYLQSEGFELISSSPTRWTLTGRFPLNKLALLNARDDIDYVRPLFEPINNAGQVVSQGDSAMRTNFVRSQFGIEGNGVTVGVLSNSYNTLGQEPHDVQEGDLPNNVQNILDFSVPTNDEGRAMAQIVHDLAPKANILFRTGIISPLDFAFALKQLALPPYNADVIVDDITYLTEPFLKDGFVAQTVNDVVTNNGVTYLTSAGNFGSRSYEGLFTPNSSAALPAGITGVAHNFGNGALGQKLHLKRGTYTIVLQWEDNFYSMGEGGAAVDMDFYLLKADGTYFGFNRNNITADPIEVLAFNVNEETDAQLLVVKAGGGADVWFKSIIFRGEATMEGYAGSGTIIGQANAEGAISVGAMLYGNVNNQIPDFPSVASFSSRGGNAVGSTVRTKPEIVAPNGVNTTVTLSTDPLFNIEPDPFPNFFGTSASAPHAAAVAALLIEGKKKFNLQDTVAPAEVKELLQTTALDLHEPGFDFKSGFGAIQADNAMLTMANAKPIISSLIPPPGLQPSNTTPFTLHVTGKYLNPQTKVYLRGAEIPTSFVNSEEVSATVSGAINDDPRIQLYNPPKSPSGLDGGLSEPLFLFSTRKAVVVRADNKTKKFGEALPAFTFSVAVDGVPANTPAILASLKLDGTNVRFATFATPTSSAANYSITPSRRTPLDPSNPTDAAIINQYTFLFLPGTLTVQKLPVKITPRSQTVTYGEFLDGVQYNFDFGGASLKAAVRDSLMRAYKKLLAGNTQIVINGLSSPTSATTAAALKNMGTLTSFQSVRNARKFVLQDGKLVPVNGTLNSFQYADQRFLVDISSESLTRYKADSATVQLVVSPPENKARGLISARALAAGSAQASLPNGSLQPVVNGTLLSMVNGALRAAVNGSLQAVVNGVWQPVQDIVVHNGQLMAAVNGVYVPVTNGQLQAVVNGLPVTLDLVMENGSLRAAVNGQLMAVVNGSLRAVVNGIVFTLLNGQLQAAVNGQLMPVVNGSLMAVVNGSLQPIVNGQLLAVVNGELVGVDFAVLENGQLMAMVNGSLRPVVNGSLMAAVNGALRAAVNGSLLAVVNGRLAFTVFENGSLQAMVNGSLQPVVNGSLMAVVNGTFQSVSNYSIVNGALRAAVNGQEYNLVNGSLQAVVNGQLLPAVNNFGDISSTNNSNVAVVMDRDDIVLQGGALGGVFSSNMITGLNAGSQRLVPGAFFDPNLDVSYGIGKVSILKAPLTVDADWKYITQGVPAPPQSFYSSTIKGLAYNDQPGLVTGITYSLSPAYSGAPGVYVITPANNRLRLANYSPVLFDTGRLYVNPNCSSANKIIVKRECVRALPPGQAGYNGFQYVATFSYENKNPTPLYIPHGPDNLISMAPDGGYLNTLPEVFEPGFHTVEVPFSGHQMYWQVRSCASHHKTAMTSSQNASSNCQVNTKVVTLTTEGNGEIASALSDQPREGSPSVYPNPAKEKIYIYAGEAIFSEKDVVVTDASGKMYLGLTVKRINESTMEIAVRNLAGGLYNVRVKTGKGYRTLRFVKL